MINICSIPTKDAISIEGNFLDLHIGQILLIKESLCNDGEYKLKQEPVFVNNMTILFVEPDLPRFDFPYGYVVFHK